MHIAYHKKHQWDGTKSATSATLFPGLGTQVTEIDDRAGEAEGKVESENDRLG